jgi:hypothetical protein
MAEQKTSMISVLGEGRAGLGIQADMAFGHRAPDGGGLMADIHHVSVALGIEMAGAVHGRHRFRGNIGINIACSTGRRAARRQQ